MLLNFMNKSKILVIVIVLMSIIGFSVAGVFGASNSVNGNQQVISPQGKVSSANNINVPAQYTAYKKYLDSNSVANGTTKLVDNSSLLNHININVSNYIYLPNYNASKMYNINDGAVTPLYSVAPAPMGIGFFGTQNISGQLYGKNYTSQSYEGSININNLTPMYLLNDAPTSVSIQLNTVLHNVTLFGKSNYDFWTQNVIFYSERTHSLEFIDNIWNFSSPATYLTSNAIYNSSYGVTLPYTGVHIALGPAFTINEPFTVHLYTNSTIIDNRNAVYFNYSIPQINKNGTYNRVIFNSTYGIPSSFKTPMADFLVSGTTITPTGYLLYDSELMIGGPGGGSTTDIYNINGTMALDYYNSTTGKYMSVPSAYDFGTDTGETSSGVGEYWSTNDVVHLTTGPSILKGMWGINNNTGYFTLTGSLAPSNGFVFVNNGAFNNLTAQWSPIPESGIFSILLSPGTYSIQFLASDHAPSFKKVTSSSGALFSIGKISLTKNLTYGGYTPLYAFNNNQLANISIHGNGTATNPYVLIPQCIYIDPVFGGLNDFGFPVFAGVFLWNTTGYISTMEEQQPSVCDYYNGAPFFMNTMPYFLYEAQNVSFVGNDIGGFLYPAYSGFIAGEITLWYSSNDLILRSCFYDTYAIAMNGSNDITISQSNFGSSFGPAYIESCYSNANIANNVEEESVIYEYHSMDNLIANTFVCSFVMSEFGNDNLRGNSFNDGALIAINSTIASSFDSYYGSYFRLIYSNATINHLSMEDSDLIALDNTTNIDSSEFYSAYLAFGYGGEHNIVNSNLNSSTLYAYYTNVTTHGGYVNSTCVYSLYSNSKIIGAMENQSKMIAEFGNFTMSNDYMSGLLYESLESNNTIDHTTIANGMQYPWAITTYYGTNNINNDKLVVSNYNVPENEYYYMSEEYGLNINSLTFNEGINTVTGTYVKSINSNEASNIIVQYGVNKITANEFYTDNVSLNGNLYGAGSSLIVYGGSNVISNNKFITINSPAKSSLMKYGDVSSGSNEYYYGVEFKEAGLPADTLWTLLFNGATYNTTNSSITLIESPGNYSYKATSAGYNSISGSVSVVSSSVTVNLPFVLSPKYTVTFKENGLPANTQWSVIFNGQTKSSADKEINFTAYNGTYTYSINGTSGYHTIYTGSVLINGSAVIVHVNWIKTTYKVSFQESGISLPATWGISINGNNYKTNNSIISTNLENGTYTYSIDIVNGYTPYSYSGSFTVNGSNEIISIPFVANEYSVVFIESGLPAGSSWSVTFNGITMKSNTTFITFENVTNGKYSYSVSTNAKGYLYSDAGNVVLSNSGSSIPISFVKHVVAPSAPSDTIPIIAGVVAGVISAFAAAFVITLVVKKHL